MPEPIDPATLAPDADLCPACSAPRPACARCDGMGGWLDDEGGPVRCGDCFGHRALCLNTACGGSAQMKKEDFHAQG